VHVEKFFARNLGSVRRTGKGDDDVIGNLS
jgi:hypothetical protein